MYINLNLKVKRKVYIYRGNNYKVKIYRNYYIKNASPGTYLLRSAEPTVASITVPMIDATKL